jgi:hypothetical protein
MRQRSLLIAAAALAVLLLPTLASADGITWTLNDVMFATGGSATGSFNYNAATAVYSAANVSTTANSPFPGTVYTMLTNAVVSGPTVIGLGPNPFADFGGGNLTGATVLELIFLHPLTSAGGTDPVFAVEFLCTNATCGGPDTRFNTTGSVSASVVPTPEPSALFLLSGGLLAIAFLRRLT